MYQEDLKQENGHLGIRPIGHYLDLIMRLSEAKSSFNALAMPCELVNSH